MAGTKSVAYFCPHCGSSSVDYSPLAGGDASCNACSWKGSREALAAYEFEHAFIDGDEALMYMMNDMRRVFSSIAVSFAGFLTKWGFLDALADKRAMKASLMRYLASASRACMIALIEERQKMEQERAGN